MSRYLSKTTLLLLPFIALLSAACSAQANPQTPTVSPSETATRPSDTPFPSSTPAPSPSETPSPSFTPIPTSTQTPTATATTTATATFTPLPSITPTWSILRGEVLERANCRYGPGYPYLYKYGLVAGSNLEVIGRNDKGTWILVRAIGGDNPCWVKADLMELKGEVMAVQPTYIPLPMSPYYAPPDFVSASREGDEVTIFWHPFHLRPGDDSGQFPYLVETWVCVDGELEFTPLGTYDTSITVQDEAGCSEPSHGQFYAVEKHGYTRWLEIPWPEH